MRFIETTQKRITDSEMSTTSVVVAYYLLLSLFPLIIAFGNILPFLHIDQETVLTYLREVIPETVYTPLMAIMNKTITISEKKRTIKKFFLFSTPYALFIAICKALILWLADHKAAKAETDNKPPEVLTYLREVIPETVYQFIGPAIKDLLTQSSGGLLSVSALAALWSASQTSQFVKRWYFDWQTTRPPKQKRITNRLNFVSKGPWLQDQ